jgi:hypothetical protein
MLTKKKTHLCSSFIPGNYSMRQTLINDNVTFFHGPSVKNGGNMPQQINFCDIQCVPWMRKRPFKGTSGATFLCHY